jgi:UDP-N-acetylmuramoyl-tripeptide--D-alanyl-D-alanine ligase
VENGVIALSAEEAGRALGRGPLALGVPGVSIDSRSIRPGDLFVALRGERFDGHDFVDAALAAGASGAVVDARWWAEERTSPEPLPPTQAEQVIYRVADTLVALGALATAVRRKSGAIVVAITGSVGKTSTKDLVEAMAGTVCRVVATAANQNNEVGVPLTLLAIEPSTEVAIVEMGMRGRGQIAALARVAEPDVGVVTNIHPVHLEVLGTLEAVAEAKSELLDYLQPTGAAVVPADCRFLPGRAAAAGCRVVRFGFGPGNEKAEVHGSLVASGARCGEVFVLRWPDGQVEIEAPFVSRYRLENTVAAAAVCYAAGLPVDQCVAGVAAARFTGSRGDVTRLGAICVINDTYNANPAAVRAALDDLVDRAARSGGRPVAVLGDMLELGPETEHYHREAGAYAAEAGVRALWGVGPLSRTTVEGYRDAHVSRSEFKTSQPVIAGHVDSAEEASAVVAGLRPGDVVLFKASRSMKLELMVDRVVEEAEAGAWGESPEPGPCPDGATRRPRL